MRRFITIFFVVLLICSFSFSTICNADGYVCQHSYHTFGDYTLIGGVGNYGYNNRYYFIGSSCSSTYVNYINNAVRYWVESTAAPEYVTPISIVRTTTRPQSVFDFMIRTLDNNVLGHTRFYNSNHNVTHLSNQGALTENYLYTYIILDDDNLAGLTNAQITATCAHELGHAMGLSHTNNYHQRIMCQYSSGRTAVMPSQKDLKAINHLY